MQKGYFHPVRPEAYPLYSRRHTRAVTREQLGDQIRFVALRGFDTDAAGNLVNISETLDAYTREFPLCDIIWPVYPTLFAPNFAELTAEAEKRGLYMFDFWGYVPGSNPDWNMDGGKYVPPEDGNNIWGEYTPPEEAYRLLENMGKYFIGFDNGEQDGRYIGSYAPMMCPASDSRRRLYQNFQAHFEKLEGHMRNNIALLASLNFLHSFAKEGNTSILGAETAQALPNVNFWFSYIRGAGKQYGLLWFGDASIWNRWGWKCYDREARSTCYEECGPECGTSLSLLRRLLYLEYLYGSDILGFESGWFLEPGHLLPAGFYRQGPKHQLSPVGMIQEDLRRFIGEHPERGALYTPVCLYLDFYNGFAPPRHLYTKEIYRVWGNHPYERGDYQLHAMFSLLCPGYEDSGFFRNEKGFMTATPHGDIADVIFSDTEAGVLDQYELVIACGEGRLDAESQLKLLRFAENGGTVLLFGNKLDGLRPELLCGEGDAAAALRGDGTPLVREKPAGCGRILNMLDDGLEQSADPTDYLPGNEENRRIVQPYRFTREAEACLAGLLDEYRIIGPDNPALGYAVNELAPDRFLLAVYNPRFSEEAFSITGSAAASAVKSVQEWEIPDLPRDTPGYYPPKDSLTAEQPCRTEGDYTVPPMGMRIFEVKTERPAVEEKPEIVFAKKELPPVYVSLSPAPTIQDAYLDIPWFENYFAGIKLDARYLEQHDPAFLEREGAYLRRRGCGVILDFTPMLNHYPDLSLIRNIPGRTEESIARIRAVLEKGKFYGCSKAILSLHRNAENALSLEDAVCNMKKSLAEIAGIARELGVVLYLQNGRSLKTRSVFAPAEDAAEFLNEEIRFAYSTAHGLGAKENQGQTTLGSVVHRADSGAQEDIQKTVREMRPAALLLAAPQRDAFGQFCDLHLPLSESDFAGLPGRMEGTFDFICLDAVYQNADQIFADYQLL